MRKNASSVVSVCPVDHHPLHCNILNENGEMKNFAKRKPDNRNRQELPDCYRINGAVYLTYVSLLRKNGRFITERTYAYKMPRERSVDIDTKLDFEFSQFLKSQQSTQR